MTTPPFLRNILSDYFRWLAIGIVVIIVGLGYWFFLSPQLSSIQSTSVAERTSVRAQVLSQQDYLNKLQSSIARFHAVLPDTSLSAINDFIPSNPDFPGLLLTIRNVASSTNVALQSLSLSQTGQVGDIGVAAGPATGASGVANAATVGNINLRTQDATVTVSGGTSYDDFKRFLNAIERSRRLLDVVSLGFSVSGTGGGSYTMTIRTYYLPSGA